MGVFIFNLLPKIQHLKNDNQPIGLYSSVCALALLGLCCPTPVIKQNPSTSTVLAARRGADGLHLVFVNPCPRHGLPSQRGDFWWIWKGKNDGIIRWQWCGLVAQQTPARQLCAGVLGFALPSHPRHESSQHVLACCDHVSLWGFSIDPMTCCRCRCALA